MDFATDSILMSHMGEGNWRLARPDRPVRLIKRPLGIGGLGDPPTFLFQYATGPATLATLVSLGGERFRLLVAEGEVLDTAELPHLEMPYGHFRPDSGVRDCMDAWLRLGGPHHQVLNPGRQAHAWQLFSELAGLELAVVGWHLNSRRRSHATASMLVLVALLRGRASAARWPRPRARSVTAG